jgi:superfamily II DNA/RNA helicase
LCQQTADACEKIAAVLGSDVRAFGVVGGVDFASQRAELLRRRPGLVVATPGRLLALCGETPASTRARQQRTGGVREDDIVDGSEAVCSLAEVGLLVLDEADRLLLDPGFEDDLITLRRLLGTEYRRVWTFFFSATWADATRAFAADLLSDDAVHITVGSKTLAAVVTVEQRVELLTAKGAPRFSRLCAVLTEYLGLTSESHHTLNADAPAAEALGKLQVAEHRTEGVAAMPAAKAAAPAAKAKPALGGFAALMMHMHDTDDEGSEDEVGDENQDVFKRVTAESDGEVVDASPCNHGVPAQDASVCTESSTQDTSPVSDRLSSPAGAPSTNAESVSIAESSRVLVFVVYKKEAKDIAAALVERGFAAVALQGDMSQSARSAALQRFRDGSANVLVATDVAARGLDIGGISHVVNFSLGGSIDTYVHRIGRCGRAGRAGVAHSFVVDGDEHLLPALVEVLGRTRQLVHPDVTLAARKAATKAAAAEARGPEGRRPLTEDEEYILEQRQANRERQLELRQQSKLKGRDEGSHRRKR